MIDLDNIRAIDLHAKGAGTAGESLADGANADNAKRQLVQGLAGDFFPFATFHGAVHPGLAA